MNTSSLKKIGLASGVIIGASLLSSCRSVESPANASQPTAITVDLAPVRSDTVQDSSEFVAQLESRQAVMLQPRVEGQIEKIFVRVGDKVEAGEPIIQIDAREQQASVASQATEIEAARANRQRAYAGIQQANANLLQAQANVRDAEATLKSLEADRRRAHTDVNFNYEQYQRFQQLYEEGAISSQDLSQYHTSWEMAKAELEAADAQIQAQQAELKSYKASVGAQQAEVVAQEAELVYTEQQIHQAQASTEEQAAKLGYHTITAPFTGTVGNIPVKVGDFVSPETQLAKLAQNDALEVNVSIPADRAPDVNVGTEIKLLNAQNKAVATSRVFFIAPNFTNGSQLLLVKARLENTQHNLRADEFVRAQVIWEQQPGLKIPTTAISRVAGQTFVFVAEPDQDGFVARQTPVELGNIEGNYYQVLAGLDPDEQIAVTGLLQLYDGAAIVPES